MVEAVLVLTWIGVTLYAVFGGADFGGGFWDLFSGAGEQGDRRRRLIADSIGPVWEANHVWLIFVLVVLWTAFPRAYAQIASTLIVPATAVAIGIILRGSGFAFRKSLPARTHQRMFGAVFAVASIITPFFLGAIAGAIGSGRIPARGTGDLLGSWVNPTSLLVGVLAVVVCAYLAAVFLTADAERRNPDLAPSSRRRALAAGTAAGVVSLGGIAVLGADAPTLYQGLTGRGFPLVVLSAVAGSSSLWLLYVHRTRAARVATVVAVAAVIWGWAAGQYPWLLTDTLTISEGTGSPATIKAVLVGLGAGTILFAPPLIYLLVLTERGVLSSHEEGGRVGPRGDEASGSVPRQR